MFLEIFGREQELHWVTDPIISNFFSTFTLMQSYPPENFKAKQFLTFDLQRKTGGFFKTGRSYAQLKRSNKEIKVKTE